MQLTSATYKENQNSIDALTGKYDILSKQLEAQKNKVNVYSNALENAKDKQKESADEVEKYSKELDSARAELEKMKSSEDSTNEAISEQEKLVSELESKLASSEAQYDKNTASVQNWQTGLNIAETNLIGMEKELETTGQYLEEAKNSTDGVAKSIDNLGKSTDKATESSLTFGEVFSANVASEVVIGSLEKIVDLTEKAGEGIYNMTVSAAKFADDTQTLSNNTGVAVDTIQALYYSEELLDTSVQTVTSSMAKNIRSMEQAKEGSENYKEAYDKLGISITDANGELRNGEAVFWEVIDALGEIENTTERDALSMQLFGKSAQNLNSLVKVGSKGFNEMKKEAKDLGYVLDSSTQASLLETSDSMERVSKATDALKNRIGASLADPITDLDEKLLKIFEDNEDRIVEIAEDIIPKLAKGIEFVIDNADKLLPLIEGLGAGFIAFKVASGAVSIASTAISLYKTVVEGATVSQGLLNAAMKANPAALVATGVGVLTTALSAFALGSKNSKTEMEKFEEELKKSLEPYEKANKAALEGIEARKRKKKAFLTRKQLQEVLLENLSS